MSGLYVKPTSITLNSLSVTHPNGQYHIEAMDPRVIDDATLASMFQDNFASFGTVQLSDASTVVAIHNKLVLLIGTMNLGSHIGKARLVLSCTTNTGVPYYLHSETHKVT